MQFSSGNHEALTLDPYPYAYVVRSLDAAGEPDPAGYRKTFDPRPEYGSTPLTNPGNPILAYARANPGEMILSAYLDRIPTADAVKHAAAVLQRRHRIMGTPTPKGD